MNKSKIKNLKTNRNIFLKNYLVENYSEKTKEEIIKDLNLSWNYIQKMACLFEIKREFNDFPRKLIKLSNFDDCISCYWLGFLLADGHISNEFNIQVNINKKDEDYFRQIENHLNFKLKSFYVPKLNAVRFILSDKYTVKKIKHALNWKTNKTKNIPKIPKLNDDQFFSLIVGFIDVDGTLNKTGNSLKIRCDSNWKKILESFYFHLTGENKIFDITKDNCSIIIINKWKTLNDIKNKAIKLNLPLMKRKWDKLNLNRYKKTEDKRLKIIELIDFNNNLKYREIKELTGCSYNFINKIKKEIETQKILKNYK